MYLKLKIGINPKVADIERLLSELEKDNPRLGCEIWISRKIGSSYFVAPLIASLIATAARRVEKLTVRDWYDRWDEEEIIRTFHATLSGFTSMVFANELTNTKNIPFPQTLDIAHRSSEQVGGLLERHFKSSEQRYSGTIESNPLGNQLSIVAYDRDGFRATPFVFTGLMHDREKFIRTFQNLKRTYLEVGETPKFREDQKLSESALANFVFEAFQNGYEHGCYSAEGAVLTGVRSLTLTRHNANQAAELASRSLGFRDLESYLNSPVIASTYRKLMEVSVCDNGLGIVNFFRSRVGWNEDEVSEPNLLERIIVEPLTSKRGPDGAGYGFKLITEAIQSLNGFMVIRTGSTRLTYSPGTSGNYEFKTEKLAKIVGTNIGFLYPLMKD